VDLTGARWNRLAVWLQQLKTLRDVA